MGNIMKELRIITTRVFPKDKDYEDYKYEMSKASEVNFVELETTGKTVLKTHQQGEVVETEFELLNK